MSKMRSPASRLITLIMLLQRTPNQKARELAERLGVSVRTLHRYFGMLDEMGIPIYSERGPNGGFSLVRGYKLPPLMFSPEEATAVYLGTSLVGEMWGQLYLEAAEGAMAKLDNVLPDEQREEVAWARRTLAATGMHRADPEMLSPLLGKIREAARAQRQIRMRYQGSTGVEASERTVDPYALAYRGGWWYMIGYCHLRQGLRTFRVDRILEMEALDQTFAIPEDFNIREYLERAFADQPVIEARLRFAPEGAHIAVSSRMIWKSLEQNPDGSVEVTLTGADLIFLTSMAISFGSWVRVIEPPELVEMVRGWALDIAKQYEVEKSAVTGEKRPDAKDKKSEKSIEKERTK